MLFKAFADASLAISSCMSVALDLDENELTSHCQDGESISLMRLFHYLPYDAATGQPDEASDGRIGSSPHTDWGWLTLILQQADVVGLQVYHEDQWWDVPPLKGAIATNIGDYIALLTRGRFHSPLHRVVTGPRDRTSWVFFSYPDYDANIPLIGEEGATAGGERTLSLLADQTVGAGAVSSDESGMNTAAVAPEDALQGRAFGDFIREKWASVSREV